MQQLNHFRTLVSSSVPECLFNFQNPSPKPNSGQKKERTIQRLDLNCVYSNNGVTLFLRVPVVWTGY